MQDKASEHVQEVTSVLTLGTFHFDFPNLDRMQSAQEERIDILEPQYQQQIEELVTKLARFRPTIIAIERHSDEQPVIDSLYQAYRQGNYELTRSEDQQIGFRLAKQLGLNKLYCVDIKGRAYGDIAKLLIDESSEAYADFEKSFIDHPDSVKQFNPRSVFKEKGIIAELIALNNPKNVKKSLGNYLIGHFKYEADPYDFTGVDFETGRWFNRNLRIFRNIQRIEAKPSDKILVIFGAGHLNILNYLFECSPEYFLSDTDKYLNNK